MSNIHNGSMLNQSHLKSPSEIATEIFQGTAVESAYDKKGKFSHLLARLSPTEFVRLYSPHTTASIFIKGFWLQLCVSDNKKKIINRETQCELGLEVAVNEFGMTILSFFRFSKRIARFKLKHISAADLLNTEQGYHCLARAAVKVFYKVQPIQSAQKLAMTYLPVVLVLMQKEKNPRSATFSRNAVLLQ